MVKKCQMRRCSKLYIRFRLQKSRESMTMESEMRTTKQDGDEGSFLRAQTSQCRRQQDLAMKFRRSVKGRCARSTI